MRRRLLLPAVVVALAAGGYAIAQGTDDEGVIGPQNRVQPSGRKLTPAGKRTVLGNLPTGGALTPDGRFLWTVSAGRGPNDVRIVRVAPSLRCKVRRRACRRRRARQVGRHVQTIPMPGLSGGIAMAPDGRTAYVSGVPESTSADQESPADTPGKEGDVIHVLRYGRDGRASRDGVISVPPPSQAPAVQDFPPRAPPSMQSWPRDLAVSADGKTLLAALNLADHAAVIDTGSRQVRYVADRELPLRRRDSGQPRLRLERERRHGVGDRPARRRAR